MQPITIRTRADIEAVLREFQERFQGIARCYHKCAKDFEAFVKVTVARVDNLYDFSENRTLRADARMQALEDNVTAILSRLHMQRIQFGESSMGRLGETEYEPEEEPRRRLEEAD